MRGQVTQVVFCQPFKRGYHRSPVTGFGGKPVRFIFISAGKAINHQSQYQGDGRVQHSKCDQTEVETLLFGSQCKGKVSIVHL